MGGNWWKLNFGKCCEDQQTRLDQKRIYVKIVKQPSGKVYKIFRVIEIEGEFKILQL